MNERISLIRKQVGLTQEKFADRIGLTKNFVWMIEKGQRIPSDRTISDICREFGVNETWLRTGAGEMFQKRSRDEELAAFFGEVLSAEPDFRRRLISALSRLSTQQWEVLEQIANNLLEETKTPVPNNTGTGVCIDYFSSRNRNE